MQITVLKSKIHRATVTDANLEYVGSITIDKALLKKAGMHPWEKVDVLNVNNGERRKAAIGDKVIIVTYTQIEEADADSWQPNIVLVDDKNAPLK